MKRILCLLLVLVCCAAMCSACSALAKGTCEECGQTEVLKTYKDHNGQPHKLCDDCYRLYKFLGY